MTELKTKTVRYCTLGFADVDQILDIEQRVYSHPWSRGNFTDAFLSGYEARGLRDASEQLLAYFVVMPVLDELHLLNLAVSANAQGRGYARLLLDKMQAYAKEKGHVSILLEVRAGNRRAIDVYLRYGFIEIGRRKGYYPAAGDAREDAIVMRRLC